MIKNFFTPDSSKSAEYNELKTVCAKINDLTYDVLTKDFIDKQYDNIEKCDKNNEFNLLEQHNIFDCIDKLKAKQDSFYTVVDYQQNGLQKGIKYFELLRGGVNKYRYLGEYKETAKKTFRGVSGGHGHSNADTTVCNAFIFENDFVCDTDELCVLKDQTNISPPPRTRRYLPIQRRPPQKNKTPQEKSQEDKSQSEKVAPSQIGVLIKSLLIKVYK